MESSSKATPKEIAYPREIFWDMIQQDSPYAFYIFQWVDYNEDAKRWRLKMHHDIELRDGTVMPDMYPNADAWSGSGGRVPDDLVARIRIPRRLPYINKEWSDPRGKAKS